jgi:hypothetical protein
VNDARNLVISPKIVVRVEFVQFVIYKVIALENVPRHCNLRYVRYADPLLFGDIRHYSALFWYYR